MLHVDTLKAIVPCLALSLSLHQALAQWHPLDALSAEEVERAVSILNNEGLIDKDTRFALMTLREPGKAETLAWRPGQPMERGAFCVVKQGPKTFEAEIDLLRGKVAIWRTVEKAQAGVLLDEIIGTTELVASDPDFQQALAKRGVEDFSRVYCPPLTASYFAIPDEEGKRLLKVPCFDLNGTTNPYAKPIEGLYAVVDLNARKVLEVVDTGVVPTPPDAAQFDEGSVGELRQKLYPIVQKQERRPNYSIENNWISWQNWKFHLRVDRRLGPVISLATYSDRGSERSVLYQGSLSEIYVPYMDPGEGWFWKTFMDAGEYGYGLLASPIVPGVDCPEHAALLSATLVDDFGKPYELSEVVAVFEQNTGMVSWRHYELATGAYEGRPSVELAVRMISAIGNYDYQIDWIFTQDGSVKVRVAATGINAVKAVSSADMRDPTATADTAYGAMIAPHIVAPNHDHWFNFRLDLDVDGVNNSFLMQRLAPAEPDAGPRQSIWTTVETIAQTELQARMKYNPAEPKLWRFINPNKTNYLGNPVSYHLAPMNSAHHDLLSPESFTAIKGGFAQRNLWVTPYRRDERYAAGAFVNQKSELDGLDKWTEADRPIENTDIVAWYTMGFHHAPRSEDWPVAPMMVKTFTLRPFNFFDKNPALDVPTRFRKSFPQFKNVPGRTATKPNLK